MNTVLSIKNSLQDIHFTHRGEQFRIVIKDEENHTFISRLNMEEVLYLKRNRNSLAVISNYENYELQNSYVSEKTVFDFENKRIFLITKEKDLEIKLENDNWEKMIHYMFEGKEGKIS